MYRYTGARGAGPRARVTARGTVLYVRIRTPTPHRGRTPPGWGRGERTAPLALRQTEGRSHRHREPLLGCARALRCWG